MPNALQHISPSEGIEQSDRRVFLDTLLHDDRNSIYFVSSDAHGIWQDQPVRAAQLSTLSFSGNANYYITHNGFSEKRRKLERTRQLNSLFFDLDCHSVDAFQARSVISQALVVLRSAYQGNVIPEPTMIVDSGRGLHLYYVLDRSIPYHLKGQTEPNKRGIDFFTDVQERLAAILADVLSQVPDIDVDKNVFDFTRVSRIPGTFNLKAGRYCELVHQGPFHNLQGLSHYRPQKKAVAIPQAKNAHVMSFQPLMMLRLRKLEELQLLRGMGCMGSREVMAFLYYNTAVQIFDRNVAEERLHQFNRDYFEPLAESEIRGIIRSVDTVVNVRGEKGHYLIRAQRVIEMLNMTENEMDVIGFFESKRAIDRAEAKRVTKQKRDERNSKIISLYHSCAHTQKEIAAIVGCSLRTVQNVLKQYRLEQEQVHNSSVSPEAGSLDASHPELNLSENPFLSPLSFLGFESAKNCQTSLRVVRAFESFDDFPSSFSSFSSSSSLKVGLPYSFVTDFVIDSLLASASLGTKKPPD